MDVNITAKDNKRSNRGWIMAIVLLLVVNVAQALYIYTLRARHRQQVTIAETRSVELEEATSSLDSLQRELYVKLEQVRKLGGDTTTLAQARRELAADLIEVRGLRSADRRKLSKLREKVDAYTYLLNSKDKEIVQLRSERDRLYAYNKELKVSMVKQNDSLTKVVAKGQELETKVALASVLRAEGIHVNYLDKNGNEREDEVIRAKKLDKFKITFYIADNKVAQMGAKDVYFRAVDPEGAPLADAQGQGGTLLTSEGVEAAYTLRQTFIFDNQHPRITFLCGNTKPYVPGTYTFELWCEGYKIGETRAVVR
jgi:hypothetical protein